MKYVLILLADVANGLFATLLAGYFVGVEPLWWHFPLGILLAMSPDLDAVGELIARRGRLAASAEHGHDHRDGLHYPLVFVIVGAAAAYLVPYWGTMFLLATTLHFVNDLYGTGWGIKLLWPFSHHQFKLLGRRANLLKRILREREQWDALPHSERRLRLVVSWGQEELPGYIRAYGIEDWPERYYLQLNWICVVEYMLFIVAVILTALTLLY